MKKLLLFLIIGNTPFLIFCQFQLAFDIGDNYQSWTNGSNEGSGFNSWSLTAVPSGGFAGHFIGNPSSGGISGMSTQSFGLFGNPNYVGNEAKATRYFSSSSPMQFGDTLKFQMGLNWDADNSNGFKGIDLINSSGTVVLNFNMGGSSTITWSRPGAGSGGDLFTTYGTNAMNFKIVKVGNQTYRIMATPRSTSDPNFDQTVTIAGEIAGFVFYIGRMNDNNANRQPYYDSLSLSNSGDFNVPADSSFTYSRNLSGSGSLSKSGNGVLTLTGANTYTGSTTVEAGTLRLNRTGGGTLPNTANVTVNGGTLRISTNQTLNNLTIASGAQVEVDEGAVLEVTGTLSNSGTITLKASSSGVGQLIHNSTASGQVVTSQYITGLATEGRWIYLGSPTSSARLDSLIEGSATMVAANSNQGTIWNWDASNGQWSAPASISDNFVVGRGYVTWIGMNGSYGPFTRVLPGKIDVYGSVTSGASDFSISLTYGGTSPNDGWNLIANPWPATYDWNGQTIGSSHFNVWVYRDGSYKTFNTDGTGDPEARYWTPMQAGFVRRDNLGPSSISFERTRRITSQNILLSKPQSGKSEVNILVKNNSTDKEDNLYITFSQGGNEQYLLSEDAEKKMNTNNYPNIFTYREGRKLIINQLPELSGYRSEPVGFQGTQAGTYTISIKNKDNFDPSISVLLEDKIMNNFALLNNADYTFVHNPVNNPDRFVLHFNKSQIGTPEMEANKFNAWVYDGVAYIRGLEHLGQSTVKISDLSGRIIASYRIDIASGSTNEIVLPSLPKGVYLLSVESVAQSKTVKFIYY